MTWSLPDPPLRKRWWWRLVVVGLGLLALGAILLVAWQAWCTRGLSKHSLRTPGGDRTFYVHLPPGHSTAKSVPLVIALHGNGGTAAQLNRATRYGLTRQADAHGWVLVIPQGISKSWNDHRPFKERALGGVDDVGFLTQLIDYAQASYGIDPERVFILGASNGGAMALTLAVERSERVRAVAAVVMSLPEIHEHAAPKRAVSVLMVNGTKDPIVPYVGGQILGARGRVLSTPASLDWWARQNGCATVVPPRQLPDADPSDGTRVWYESREGCAGGTIAALYRVEGGGHTWPGGRPYAPERLVGRVSGDIDASRVVFDFFALHAKP